MNIQENDPKKLLYCVVHAKNVSMKELDISAQFYIKVIVKVDSEINMISILTNYFEEMGIEVQSVSDTVSLYDYCKKWEIDHELDEIIKYINDRNIVSFGQFYTYE